VPKIKGQTDADQIPEEERDYYLERLYPSFGNLVPRDVASRRAKEMCDHGYGVGPTGMSVYLDFRDTIERHGKAWIIDKYQNLFDMYEQITGENAYETPCASTPPFTTHGRPLGRLRAHDHDSGLYVLGEANFSDHGANRLGRARSCRPCRWVLHPSLYDRQLSGDPKIPQDRHGAPRIQRRRKRGG